MPAGRPSDYTPEKGIEICARLAEGLSLRTICVAEDMPHRATVFRWLAIHEAFRDQYARAREVQSDTLFDDLLDIADNGSNDWMERNRGDEKVWVENGEALRRSQLRIDARKWIIGKIQPKKYGEKQAVELSGKDGEPIKTEAVGDYDIARRIAFALASAKPASE